MEKIVISKTVIRAIIKAIKIKFIKKAKHNIMIKDKKCIVKVIAV